LTQSAGANLSQQFKVFHPGGASFRHLAQRSKMGLPTATIVFGSSTAGGAYTPGMSDYVIMVKGNAQVFLGGPPLVQMATGEVTDAESLGGAEMHSRKSGVSDHLSVDEADAIRKVREWMHYLNWPSPIMIPVTPNTVIDEPVYPLDDLLGIIPANIRKPFDAMEVIIRLVDGSRFNDFKPLYGTNLITGWAHLHGFIVGIIANNNPIFPADANKAVQFIQLCNMKRTPIVFMQNITGNMIESLLDFFHLSRIHGWDKVRRGWYNQSWVKIYQRRLKQCCATSYHYNGFEFWCW
jgi:acetyl-CoA carboxylase carboxyltransferase component